MFSIDHFSVLRYYSTMATVDHTNLHLKLNQSLIDLGLECHPFKVEWYNECVKKNFQLDFEGDTLAFVIISIPSFFEKTFLPYLINHSTTDSSTDFLDQCICDCFKSTSKLFMEHEIEMMHDFEIRPGTRRPKILVQTAGHVSGAAYFYQKENITNPPWASDQNIYGVSLHPKYAGWFALRGVMIFKNLKASNLCYKAPVDILLEEEKKVELLNLYNTRWQDWTYRDIVEPIERYSKLQRDYFSTPPAERTALIERLKNNQ